MKESVVRGVKLQSFSGAIKLVLHQPTSRDVGTTCRAQGYGLRTG